MSHDAPGKRALRTNEYAYKQPRRAATVTTTKDNGNTEDAANVPKVAVTH